MTPEELEKNVKTLEDITEIQNMHRDFSFWLNSGQKECEDVIDYFAQNATMEVEGLGVKKGKKEIAQFLKELAAKGTLPAGRHMLMQPIIDVNGDKASGYWNMIYFTDVPTTPPPVRRVTDWVQGKYDCEYVREGGKWKFSSLRLTCPWPGWPERPYTPLPRPDVRP
jgi:hypothetical protein